MECAVVDVRKYRMDYEIYQLLEQSSVIYLTLRSEPKKEILEFFNFFSKVRSKEGGKVIISSARWVMG